jgi:hypothetical protein
MSHACEEYYTLYEESFPRARKEHVCAACKETIRGGDRYARVFILGGDKTAETVKRCLGCQRIHEHLRQLNPGETWPDERLACGEDYEDEWGGPPPEDIARIAFMTPDEMQRELAK